ncbi:MAG TPA: serine hydrolase domain-containing protein [Gaiellaceae bacterium]
MRAILTAAAVVAALSVASTPRATPLARIDASLARFAQQGRFSGVVLVARHGRPVLQRAHGIANRRTGERNTMSTRFNLASLGKPLTAVAVAQLVERGKLRFGDTIGRFVPELPAAIGKRVTVAELLDHTSGLGDFFASPLYPQRRPTLTSLRRYLPLIENEPLASTPGSRFHYSNSGYILLGLIVERASGEDYYAYLEHHVLAPAGMTHSGCFAANRLPPRTAVGYAGGQPNTSGLPPRGTSAGGCYSTAGDLLAFANALESHRLIDARLTGIVTSPKVSLGPVQKYGYGFGIREGRPGQSATIWHNGGSPGVGAELDINPALGYTVVVLANLDYELIAPAIDSVLSTLGVP